MGDAESAGTPVQKKGVGVLQKQQQHLGRIKRTAVASFMGLIAGALSYLLAGPVDLLTGLQPQATIGLLLMIASIVLQKYIFLLIRIDYTELTGKDWFYQGFITFAFWYISWTLLLTPAVLSPA
jgi:hypothetical protein